MKKWLKRKLLKLFITLVFLLKPCLPAKGWAADPVPRPVVHLEEGQPAPYSGDLVQPVTLLTLAAEHKQLRTMKRRLADAEKLREQDRVFWQGQLDAVQAALEASERQKVPAPVPSEDDGPGFFEQPVVILSLFCLGVAAGAGGMYAVTR